SARECENSSQRRGRSERCLSAQATRSSGPPTQPSCPPSSAARSAGCPAASAADHGRWPCTGGCTLRRADRSPRPPPTHPPVLVIAQARPAVRYPPIPLLVPRAAQQRQQLPQLPPPHRSVHRLTIPRMCSITGRPVLASVATSH